MNLDEEINILKGILDNIRNNVLIQLFYRFRFTRLLKAVIQSLEEKNQGTD